MIDNPKQLEIERNRIWPKNPIEKAWQHHKDQYPGEVQWERCAFVSGWDAAIKQNAKQLVIEPL